MATKKPEAAADAAPEATIYTVLDALDHDGKRYSAGDLVELTRAQANALPAGIAAPAPARE